MLAELSKWNGRDKLYRYGHFSQREIKELKKQGWRVGRIEKKVQFNKAGIPFR